MSSFFFSFYSEVWKAKDRTSGKYVALKKVLMENEKEGVYILIIYLKC